jgi:GMP reductase|tara:strand:- start:6215 stop:7285 length:1071 start_codon:yes stop_codon:yes gene_type:complete
MKIVDETKLDFDDILLVPARSPAASRKEVELKRTFKFFHSTKEWTGLPIMAANMDTTGSFKMGTALNKHDAVTCLHKHYDAETIDEYFAYYNIERNVWISVGMGDHELDRLLKIKSLIHHSPNICIDIANGYTEKFVEWCSKIRHYFNDSIIMAGNVCTPEMVQELILHGGVDIVKIGIGPGSACTTRLKTGVGYPQLSAIIECSHAAHGLKNGERRMGLICADGGCRIPADVCKAFAANADFVMLGGMLAGTDECEGDWEYEIDDDGEYQKSHLSFYGMSSEKAQKKHNGGMSSYASSEGRIKMIPYKGLAGTVMNDIEGGLRSCCAYVGATSLKDLPKCAKAVKVNRVHFDGSV